MARASTGVGGRLGGGGVDRAGQPVSTRQWRMAPTSSSKVIQLRYWVPGPIRPTEPHPEQRELLAQAHRRAG